MLSFWRSLRANDKFRTPHPTGSIFPGDEYSAERIIRREERDGGAHTAVSVEAPSFMQVEAVWSHDKSGHPQPPRSKACG